MKYLIIILIFAIFFIENGWTEKRSKCSESLSSPSSSTPSSSSRHTSTLYKKHPKQSNGIPKGYVDGKLCNRECDGRRMSCYFSFSLETFYTMSKACWGCPSPISDCFRKDCIVAGGVKRTVMVMNRQIPSPAIEVCQGDEIMAHFENHLLDGESTAIHWHGQHMKRDPYMDGVPFVTQCPIYYNNNFTYEYWADNAGTYWWHTHFEMQHGDGAFGALIIRQPPKQNKHYYLYDTDLSSHVIMAGDWNDRLRLDVLTESLFAGGRLEPTGILINGLGPQFSNNITNTPMANFIVENGKRHRFRFIHVGFFDCPLEISIEGHKMTIIAVDGYDVEPVEVDSFVATIAERYDFILHANQPSSTYFIKAKGYHTCARLKSYSLATLQYKKSEIILPQIPTYENAAPLGGVILNPMNKINVTGYSKLINVDELKSLYVSEYGLNTKNPYRFFINVDMSAIDHPLYNRYPFYGYDEVEARFRVRTPQFNKISYMKPDVPLLPARRSIDSSQFCNSETVKDKNCSETICRCLHVLEVPLGAVVEIVFLKDSPALHPMHVHGYSFRVVAIGETPRNFISKEKFIEMDKLGQIKRNFHYPPLKDTMAVPKSGYSIIRFIADNPGYWITHCHIDIHSNEGMDFVLKVGENDEMLDPPENFPTCGSWPY